MTEGLRQNPYRLGGLVGGYEILMAACDLGPAAAPLIPELAKFLDAPVFCRHAAEAILRAGLGDLSLSTLAGHLVTAVGADGGRNHTRAGSSPRDEALRRMIRDFLEEIAWPRVSP